MAGKRKRGKNKLPSGNVRKQIDVGTDGNGRRIRKSFSGSTAEEVDLKIAEFRIQMRKEEIEGKGTKPIENENGTPLTIEQATENYIQANVGTLSPSTIRGYEAIFREHIKGSAFGKLLIARITNVDLQAWISLLSTTKSVRGGTLSAKTVRNEAGLVTAVIRKYRPDFMFNVTLPRVTKPDLYMPDDDDINAVLSAIDRQDLLAAALLYCMGPARRSEICALTWSDVSGTLISINKAMVLTTDNEWVVKPYPKTEDSIRVIDYPQFVIDLLPEKTGDRIINMNPAMISNEFSRTVDRLGLPHFSIHSLRHYAASALHAAGIPDLYVADRGGWNRNSPCLKTVYEEKLETEAARQNEKINDLFTKKFADSAHDGTRMAHGQS